MKELCQLIHRSETVEQVSRPSEVAATDVTSPRDDLYQSLFSNPCLRFSQPPKAQQNDTRNAYNPGHASSTDVCRGVGPMSSLAGMLMTVPSCWRSIVNL
jgi:hypothetical protein